MNSSNGYPFMSRRRVLERIAAEPAFAVECVRMIDSRNGWMVSHRAAASKLVAKIAAGATDESDCAEAARLASRYGKTLARLFRERDLADRPELAAVGAVFGVVPTTTPNASPQAPAAAAAAVASSPSVPEGVAAPKRRGRPKGSKNRTPRAEPKTRRRKAAS